MSDVFSEALRRFVHAHPTGNGDSARLAEQEFTPRRPDPPIGEDSYTTYLRTVWSHLARRRSRGEAVYIFGAGAHTRWLLDITRDLPPLHPVCVLDDDPCNVELGGYPIRRPGDVRLRESCVILISSDRCERRLYERARACFGPQVEVLRLYESLPPGPYPRPETPARISARRRAVDRARTRWGAAEFVGPYERAGYVTGFLEEQWLWSQRRRLRGDVLDMSTPRYWHAWVHELPGVDRVRISNLDGAVVTKLWHRSPVDIEGDFCAHPPPAAPRSFDAVLCCSILEHCADPPALLANLRTVLRPGGALLVIVPFACPDGHDRPDYWRFAADGLRLLATQAGFAEIMVGGLGDLTPSLHELLGEGPADRDRETDVRPSLKSENPIPGSDGQPGPCNAPKLSLLTYLLALKRA